jgi:hypothetical protein
MQNYIDDYIPNQRRLHEIYQGKIALGGDDDGLSIPLYRSAHRFNPWIAHVKDVQASNPGMSYGEAMSMASEGYSGGIGKKQVRKRSGSKIARGWQSCIKNTRRKNPRKKMGLKEISKYYCIDDKLCYRTQALKNKKCGSKRAPSRTATKKRTTIRKLAPKKKQTMVNPWVKCLKKLGARGLTQRQILDAYNKGCKIPKGYSKKKL